MKMILVIFSFFIFACGNTYKKTEINSQSQISGKDTCDSPDADIGCNFRNAPSELTEVMTICGDSEPGQKIRIDGQILKSDGVTPYSGIIIYAYQTDSTGHYSKSGNESGAQKWQGRLHGWCKTDSEGKYVINTIRPGRYPSNEYPAHIHWAIMEPDGKMQYLNDFVFSDDSLVTKEYVSNPYYKTGDIGVLTLSEPVNGIMTALRITVLK
ncbi:MAG: intradiol ring-cleavage dioxygenase [Bacteroidetes bacterium]|nr:intradiol ring-cleavage dioxygenase [Bacteroidota bacterium]